MTLSPSQNRITKKPSQNRITKKLPFLSPIRAPGELWSTPGTFTRTSSIVRGSRERTATCRRHCPRASWSLHWRQCMPVRRSSARFRRARSAVGLDWPSRGEGLSDRESKILALITQGESNAGVLWSWTNYPIAGCVQPGTREGSCASIGAMDAPSAGFKTVGVVQQKRATLRRP